MMMIVQRGGGPKLKAVAVSVLIFCGIVTLLNLSQLLLDNNSNNLHDDGQRRQLSKSLPNGGCEITWPTKPPSDIEITYAASYPGCGARMTWNLVEALTGLETGDDWNNNGRGSNVVTVKTHYPQSNGILVEFDEQIKRVFIVIRNPMKSIPSFFNHIYEMRNHLPVHSERAPLDEWTKWRDAYLDIEIAEYKKFIIYWMDRYTPENRLLLTYEGLTDDLIGPEVTKTLNDFLGKANGVTPIESESVACIWKAVVKNQPPEHQKKQFDKLQSIALNQPQGSIPVPSAIQPPKTNNRRGGDKEGDTKEERRQQRHQARKESVQQARNAKDQSPPPVERHLEGGVQSVQQDSSMGGSSTSSSNTALSIKEMYLRNSAIPLLLTKKDVNTVPNQDSATNIVDKKVPPPPINKNDDVDPLDLLNEEMKNVLVGGQELLIRTRRKKPFNVQQLDTLSKQQESFVFENEIDSSRVGGRNRRLQLVVNEEEDDYDGDDEMMIHNQSHRRLDPGHHNSQRAGPDVPRPYLPRQLDNLMQMLLEIANMYEKKDVRLYHIMMGYYEQIRSERVKMNSDEPMNVKSAGGFY
jgi:hypothetical protein